MKPIPHSWLRLWALLLFVAVLGLSVVRADDLVALHAQDGQPRNFPGVMVQQLTRESGAPVVRVVFADGSLHPLPLSQVISIRFGQAGEGRQFNLEVGDGTTRNGYPGSILFSFENGQFRAQPPDEQRQYYLRGENVLSFIAPGFTPPSPGPAFAAAPDPAAANEDDLFGSPAPEDDMFASSDSGSSFGDETTGGGGDQMVVEEVDFSDPESLKRFLRGGQAPAPGAFKVLNRILLFLALFNLIFCAKDAFQTGKWIWGIFILIGCCCCPIPKAIYVFFMSEENKSTAMITVWLEVALWLGLNIWSAVGGFAAF